MRILFRILFYFLSAYSMLFLIGTTRLLPGEKFWLGVGVAWLLAALTLEALVLIGGQNRFPRLLKHARYGPFAVALVFVVVTISVNAMMIEYSKYTIRSYVFGDTSPRRNLDVDLHNDYRGFCGNGHSAREYWLYAETAAEGFSSDDPAVRARSLRASIKVYDWLNGVTDGPFPRIIEEASADPDPLVREIALEFKRSRAGY